MKAYWGLGVAALVFVGCNKDPNEGTDTDSGSEEVIPVVTAEFFDNSSSMDLSENVYDASAVSTPWMMFLALSPSGLTGLVDGDCPAVTPTDNGQITQGDCTDGDGNVWYGTATVSGLKTTYEGFGTSSSSACLDEEGTNTAIYDGEVTLAPAGGQGTQFEADLLIHSYGLGDDCIPFDRHLGLAYRGEVEYSGEDLDTDGQPDDGIFNGSGLYGVSDFGRVYGVTVNERINSVECEFEAADGNTTITADDQTAVINYNGASDCDENATVTWTLDGEDQGELEHVSCSSVGVWSSLWALPALLLVRRRKHDC